jgi:hypothetical protein
MKKLVLLFFLVLSFNASAQIIPPTVTVIITNPICNGDTGTITLNATGGIAPYNYSLYNSNNVVIAQSLTPVFTGVLAGAYTASVKDSNGTNTVPLNIVITSPIPLTTSTIITSNQTITVTATGGVIPYLYSISGITPISGGVPQASNVFTNLPAGTYTTYVTDANGCITANTITITPLLLTVTPTITNPLCNGSTGTITLNATGGIAPYNYSLYNSNNVIIAQSLTPVFTGVLAGAYTASVKDSNGTNTVPLNIVITSPSPLTASTIITSNQTITVTATGGVIPYLYSINGGAYQASNVFTNLPAGTYITYVKDANGCITTNTINVLIPLTVTPTITNPICNGDTGTITLNATGGIPPYNYSLYNSNNVIIAQSLTPVFTGVLAGAYTASVKDSNGTNTVPLNIVITSPIPLTASAIITSNQTITVTATGGVIPYLYSINGGTYQASNILTNLPAGTYSTYVKDANGCITILNPIVNVAAPLINNNSTASLKLSLGSTLENITVTVQGNSITWYSNPGTLKKTSKTIAETPLPLKTVLVNNTTYYASQTINGFESQQRLAVTITLAPLSAQDFIFENFKYYPNPVKDNFSFSNTSIINNISISDILGKTVLNKNINSFKSDIDLSNLSKGIYYVKVNSGEQEKVMKVVKQ